MATTQYHAESEYINAGTTVRQWWTTRGSADTWVALTVYVLGDRRSGVYDLELVSAGGVVTRKTGRKGYRERGSNAIERNIRRL